MSSDPMGTQRAIQQGDRHRRRADEAARPDRATEPHRDSAGRPARADHGVRSRLLVDVAMLVAGERRDRGWSRTSSSEPAALPVTWIAVFGVLVLVMFGRTGHVQPALRSHLLDEIRPIVSATAVATMARDLLPRDRRRTTPTPRQTAQAWHPRAPSPCRLAAPASSSPRSRAIARGEGRPTLIVGAGKVGHLVARRLIERPEFGLTPVGFLDNDPLEMNGPARLCRSSARAGTSSGSSRARCRARRSSLSRPLRTR